MSEQLKFNPFLDAQASSKGGEMLPGMPGANVNIVVQTSNSAPDPFESGLADALMNAYGAGASHLSEVIDSLNSAGHVDRSGKAWTERSFTEQLAKSANGLFEPYSSSGAGA